MSEGQTGKETILWGMEVGIRAYLKYDEQVSQDGEYAQCL
jgi:hypothetical protein